MTFSLARRQRRHGGTLAESVMALVILVTALGLLGQAISSAYRQHKTARLQITAQLEAANLLEQILALPWESVSGETDFGERIAAGNLSATMPNCRARVEVDGVDGDRSLKRIRVTIEGPESSGRARLSLAQLVGWMTESPRVPDGQLPKQQ